MDEMKVIDIKLLPCPFCGGKAHLVTNHNMSLTWVRYTVKCERCLTESYKYEDYKTAISCWNRRQAVQE